MSEERKFGSVWSNADKWVVELIEQKKADAKRWFIISMFLLAAFVVTNAYWIHAQNSYEYVYQDGSGQNNYNNNIGGDVHNVAAGESEEERQE